MSNGLSKGKKKAPEHAYDSNFIRCVKKTGKWRGKLAALYVKYKKVKKIFPQPFIRGRYPNEIIVVPKGVKDAFPIAIKSKMVYQPMVNQPKV